jgi:hypothetical protein
MSHHTETLEQASIRESCKVVRTPAVAPNRATTAVTIMEAAKYLDV